MIPEWSRQLFDKARHKSEDRSYIYGTLGKHNPADDTISFEVTGRIDDLWVTVPGKGAVAARNEFGVPQVEDMQVKMRLDHGAFVIVGRSTRGELSQPTPTPPSGVPPHVLEEHANFDDSGEAVGDAVIFDGNNWVSTPNAPVVVAATIHAATTKATPGSLDEFGYADQAAAFVIKKITYANIRDAIKTYYDSVVATLTNKTIDASANTLTHINTSSIETAAITNAKLADMPGNTVIGNTSVSSAVPQYSDIPSLLGQYLHAAPNKATPVVGDELGGADSAASFVLTKFSFAAIRDTIKSYYDSVVATLTNKSIDASANTLTNVNTSALANDAVSNAKLANMAANTLKANVTGSTADPADVDAATLLAQYIHAATGKTTPVDADELALIDSAASNVLKKVTWANLKATVATYYNSLIATLTNKTLDSSNIGSLTGKTTPLDADSFVILDSAAINFFKAVTGTNLKAYLKTYLDTLYIWAAGKAGGQVQNGGTAANENMTIRGTAHATKTTSYVLLQDTGGNVGIGIALPTSLLHLAPQAGLDGGIIVDASAAGSAQRATGAWVADGGNFFFRVNGTTATGTRFGIALADAVELVSVTLSAMLLGTNDANPLIFGTNNIERMRILSTGLVGIGTTPVAGAILDILGSLAGVLKARLTNSSSSSGAYASYQLINDTGAIGAFFMLSSANNAYAGPSSFNMVNAGPAPLGFGTDDTIRMRIDATGNVVIGLAAAQGLLHAHDGVGGSMFVTKTAVSGTAVVILSTATGKPTAGVTCTYVLKNNTSGVSTGGTFFVALSGTFVVTVSTTQWTFTLSATGQFSVIRTSGPAVTATISMQLVWR